ncbi:hypothetical protein GJU94_16385, partial [Brucella sp. 10RB9214]|uniref:hypothetical protein n=3 Tax=unclassified Brucella TaxID=2632610 RepID=UPI00132B50D8
QGCSPSTTLNQNFMQKGILECRQGLMRALPISSLEPYHVASIRGVGNPLKKSPWDQDIDFLEPPAGQRLPYIHPLDALEKLLGSQEETHDEWLEKAQLFERELKLEITSNKWARFYHHLEQDMQEAIPVPDFLAWLRKKSIVSSKITDLFEEANAAAIKTPIFTGPDNRGSPWSLETLPDWKRALYYLISAVEKLAVSLLRWMASSADCFFDRVRR